MLKPPSVHNYYSVAHALLRVRSGASLGEIVIRAYLGEPDKDEVA